MRAARADALLLLAAIVWGFAFVAQRAGMEHVGPFTFNAVRFALGSLFLLPFWRHRFQNRGLPDPPDPAERRRLLRTAAIAGVILFGGASLQQIGIVYTTAGKAGFITGLYVVLVPILGLRLGHRVGVGGWTGAWIAAAGLYLLSVRGAWNIALGDGLVLASAFFWAAHVLVIAWGSPRTSPVKLATLQFAICSVLSFVAAMTETWTVAGLRAAAIPILYGGILSVGLGYTLQVVAQRDAGPTAAAILLSLESVFAALGGWWLLGETLAPRGMVGCGLMLGGALLSQLWPRPAATLPRLPSDRG